MPAGAARSAAVFSAEPWSGHDPKGESDDGQSDGELVVHGGPWCGVISFASQQLGVGVYVPSHAVPNW